jgi:regulator of sigma E protease
VQGASVDIETADSQGHLALRHLNLASLNAEDLDSDFLAKLGLAQYRPPIAPVIGQIVEGSVAQRAGLHSGDLILSAQRKSIGSWSDFVSVVRGSPQKRLDLEIQRGGERRNIALTPEPAQENGATVGKIGAAPQVDEGEMAQLFTEVRYPVFTALAQAVKKTWDTSIFSLKMLGKMVVGQISLKNLSGPITIADYAGQTAKLGWLPYVSFIALISISLGVLNLLPIPLLDGGHLMYYIAEIIKGSPVSERIMETGQQIGLALLVGLMLFAFYNDINRLITG